MPLRDENGKRLSGAAQRKVQAQREAPDAAPRQQPRKTPKRTPAKTTAPAGRPAARRKDEPEDLGANPFDELEPAPIEDTSRLITWGAKLHALVLQEIAKDRSAYPNRREWYRALLGATTSLGVIRDKAMEQQKIDEALRRDEQKGKRQGLSSAVGRKAKAITRPSS